MLNQSLLILFCSCFFVGLQAQEIDKELILQEIHGFKARQFSNDGTELVRQLLEGKREQDSQSTFLLRYNQYQKTAISVLANADSLQHKIKRGRIDNGFVFRKIFLPFESWIDFARPSEREGQLELTALLSEDYHLVTADRKREELHTHLLASRYEGFYQLLGQQNAEDLLGQVFGDIDLFRDESQLMLLSFKGPLALDSPDVYQFYITGSKQIDGVSCTEVAFYSENPKTNAFAGYLYIIEGNEERKPTLLQAVFTLNDPERMNFIRNLLITHTFTVTDSLLVPLTQVYRVILGDPYKGSLLAKQTIVYDHYTSVDTSQEKLPGRNTIDKSFADKDSLYWEQVRPIPLTASQTQVEELMSEAKGNKVFALFQDAVLILLSNHVTIGGINGSVELGPVSQFISYNEMEGVRIRLGGNTNINLLNHFQVGGYVAYGTSDGRFKYRGDLTYSFLPRKKYIWEYPKRLLNFTYVNDLNIPGQDLLTSTRDKLIYSFSHTPTDNMAFQRIGDLTYEQEIGRQFSFKVGGKYTYDEPIGVVKYMQVSGTDTAVVSNITSSEAALSLSYSPGQRYIQNRDKRIIIRHGDIELTLNHRVGLKGVLGSDYTYQITDFALYKKVAFPKHIGSLDMRFSGGKVWDRVPFPLLFIPIGNQSFIFHGADYNCMDFYEFTTDRYLAGNVNFLFNWSPVKWFNKQSKIQLSVGGRMIYGPLSDNNNPDLHPELFVFNQGVKPLGNTPYAELNVGLVNLFKFLRVEYARRLTYLSSTPADAGKDILKGSLLVNASFAF